MAAVSLTIVYAKQSLAEVSYFSFLWLQMLAACIGMLIYTLVIKRETNIVKVTRRTWLLVVGIGLLNYAIVRSLFIFSLELLPVTTHAYIMNFVGIATVILSSIILREHPTRIQLLGSLIALAGLWMFFFQQPSGSEIIGIFWLVIAVLCLALTNILIRLLHLAGEPELSSNQVATFAICIGSTPLIIWGLLVDLPLPDISINNWIIISLNGLVAVGVVMVVFSQVMQYLKAYEASIIATSGVIFSALFAMPVLGDFLTVYEISGILIMLLGIILVQRKTQQQEQ